MDIPVRIAQIRTGLDGRESYHGLFRQILATRLNLQRGKWSDAKQYYQVKDPRTVEEDDWSDEDEDE